MSASTGTTTGTVGKPDDGWPSEFKRTALIVVAASGAVALATALIPAMAPSSLRPRGQSQAAAVEPDEMGGDRFAPKISGSQPGRSSEVPACRLPILIYRLADREKEKVWLRPEGGGMLQPAAPEDLISATDAVAYYDSRITEDPRDALAWTLRAMLRADLGDDDRALGDCAEAIRLDPKRPWTYFYRTLVWLRGNEADKTRGDLQRAIKIDGQVARLRWARGNAWTIQFALIVENENSDPELRHNELPELFGQ